MRALLNLEIEPFANRPRPTVGYTKKVRTGVARQDKGKNTSIPTATQCELDLCEVLGSKTIMRAQCCGAFGVVAGAGRGHLQALIVDGGLLGRFELQVVVLDVPHQKALGFQASVDALADRVDPGSLKLHPLR